MVAPEQHPPQVGPDVGGPADQFEQSDAPVASFFDGMTEDARGIVEQSTVILGEPKPPKSPEEIALSRALKPLTVLYRLPSQPNVNALATAALLRTRRADRALLYAILEECGHPLPLAARAAVYFAVPPQPEWP